MAKKKKQDNPGGIQQSKLSVVEKEELKAERAEERKVKEKERKKKEKKERKRRNPFIFFKNVFGELKKVTWPTFGQTLKKTGVVLAVVLVFSLVVFGIDQGLSQLYQLLTRGFSPY